MTKRETYIAATRALLNERLQGLLLVESPERHLHHKELPSWVPDLTSRQSLAAINIMIFAADFKAAPWAEPKIRFIKSVTDDVLVLNGVCIGTITETSSWQIGPHRRGDSRDHFTLIDWDPCCKRLGPSSSWSTTLNTGLLMTPKPPAATILNTSWGPRWGEAGDSIIIAQGCCVPLVLRNQAPHNVFVGACLLLQGKLIDSGKMSTDPGFSDIMRGSAWEEVGKTPHEEEFHIR